VLAFVLGLCIGFISSIPPLGPGSLLMVRRGLEGRFSAGIAVASGGAIADALYCALAVVGFSYLFWKHPDIAASMRWLGVAILIGIGAWFLTRKAERAKDGGSRDDGGDWPQHAVLGFSLVAFNPTLLITWSTAVALIASLGGLFFAGTSRWTFPLGVALGDVAWAALALTSLRRLGRHLPDRILSSLMRSIGAGLIVLACVFAMKTWMEN
jgi:threonine/homoserine/homoserine lactone efflux protein